MTRAFDALSNAVSVRDPLETARATKAFKYFLDVHLDKEDAHLYRLIGERVSLPDQGQAVGLMASTVPEDRFPELVAWMFPLMGDDDRENMTRIWQHVMPPEAFAGATQLVAASIGDDWSELTRRIPELAVRIEPTRRLAVPEPLDPCRRRLRRRVPRRQRACHRVLRQPVAGGGPADGAAQPAHIGPVPALTQRPTACSPSSRAPANHSNRA